MVSEAFAIVNHHHKSLAGAGGTLRVVECFFPIDKDSFGKAWKPPTKKRFSKKVTHFTKRGGYIEQILLKEAERGALGAGLLNDNMLVYIISSSTHVRIIMYMHYRDMCIVDVQKHSARSVYEKYIKQYNFNMSLLASGRCATGYHFFIHHRTKKGENYVLSQVKHGKPCPGFQDLQNKAVGLIFFV